MINKSRIYYIVFLFLTTGLILTSCTPTPQYLRQRNIKVVKEHKNVRVLILKTRYPLKIEAKSRLKIRERDSGRIVYDAQKASLRIGPGKVRQGLIIESYNDVISVNGKEYRGRIEIKNTLGKLMVINHISLEDYIKGVVPGEVPSLWPEEVLKAQAVAARTYAMYHLNKKKNTLLYDLDGTTNFQVYKGKSGESASTNSAVDKTRGEYLVHGYQPILAYFHSTCGGRTIDDRYVWKGSDMPYLKGKRCPYCSISPNYNWETRISLVQMQASLSKKYPTMGSIKRIAFKRKAGRVALVQIGHSNGTLNITGNEFRLMFPVKTVKSLYFVSKKSGRGLVLHGHGWGHGVGMCQWGAKGMAMEGKSYRDILLFYYSDVKIYRGDYRNVAKKGDRGFSFFNN